MDSVQKIDELKRLIESSLTPLIQGDYRLLEIPDYSNVGDMLIFQGELAFLKTVRHKCLEMASMRSFAYRLPRISTTELLVFRGGGYFGNLWQSGFAFQRKMLSAYPNNPMVIFPQSVHFTDEAVLRDAVVRYGEHRNLTLCLRDMESYEFVKKHFKNNCVLVPDMAFYADIKQYIGANKVQSPKSLLLKRDDKEFVQNTILESIASRLDVDVMDWPAMSEPISQIELFMRRIGSHPEIFSLFSDWFVKAIYRPYILRSGVRFLQQYSHIYSTRLHGCILGFLLGKRVSAFDNSYGKISSLIRTWLSDCDNVELCQ